MKTELKVFSFELGDIIYEVKLHIKGGTRMDPTFRGIILDIYNKNDLEIRYIRYTSGEYKLWFKKHPYNYDVNSWREAKQIILNYILNGQIS